VVHDAGGLLMKTEGRGEQALLRRAISSIAVREALCGANLAYYNDSSLS
jgi:hypothetical protein